MTGDSVIGYVANSSVRTDVLLAVEERPLVTDALLERVEASESAVYNALSALERRELIASTEQGWTPTGSGTLVATALADQRALGTLVEDDYWRRHDASPLPERFRTSAGALAGCRVARASDADPYGLVREISGIIESADRVDIASPIYQTEYARSMPDSPDARLILDRSVVEETVGDPDADVVERDFERTSVRLLEFDVALTVTDSAVVLSLPTLEGNYDPRASIIAEHGDAIEWGESLFERFWRDGTPIEEAIDLEAL